MASDKHCVTDASAQPLAAAVDQPRFCWFLIDPAALERVESVAKTLLRTLTHTPMTALGINFEFIEDDASEPLKKIFPQDDATRIAAADFITGDVEVHRELRRTRDQDGVMKVALRRSNSDVTIHLNFHKDVADAVGAATYLDGRVSKCRDLAVRFLQDSTALN